MIDTERRCFVSCLCDHLMQSFVLKAVFTKSVSKVQLSVPVLRPVQPHCFQSSIRVHPAPAECILLLHGIDNILFFADRQQTPLIVEDVTCCYFFGNLILQVFSGDATKVKTGYIRKAQKYSFHKLVSVLHRFQKANTVDHSFKIVCVLLSFFDIFKDAVTGMCREISGKNMLCLAHDRPHLCIA